MSKRCPTCNLKIEACYCHTVEQYHNQTKIVILQHPDETKHHVNTAKMASLVFKNCEIWSSEKFDLDSIIKNNKCALVFPTDSAKSHETVKEQFDIIFIIDGTWKKAKKILYTNPILKTLPALMIKEQMSIAQIRVPPKQGLLTTLETVVVIAEYFDNQNYEKALAPLLYVDNYQKKFL